MGRGGVVSCCCLRQLHCHNNFLDVEGGSGISDVINFRLEQVMVTYFLSWFRSSCLPRVYADYYFFVEAGGCVRVSIVPWDWILSNIESLRQAAIRKSGS